MMGKLLTVVFLFLILLLFILGPGIGIGFLLHWLLPAVELGPAILIGVVGTGFSCLLIGRLLAMAEESDIEEEEIVPPIVLRPVFQPPRRPRRKKASE
jgi:hypothetical protein